MRLPKIKCIQFTKFKPVSGFKIQRAYIGTILILFSFLIFTGCSPTQAKTALIVGAASSLNEPLMQLSESFTENTGITVQISFASSGTLRKQLQEGAPFDLVILASEKDFKPLTEDRLILSGRATVLLSNQLWFVSKSPVTLNTFKDHLLTANLIAIGDPASVPVGQYAQEVLTYYGMTLIPKEKQLLAKDARQVIHYINSGQVDAGFIYASDFTLIEEPLYVLKLPAISHSPILYPAGVTSKSNQPDTAQKFLDYLSEKKSTEIFESFGFSGQ